MPITLTPDGVTIAHGPNGLEVPDGSITANKLAIGLPGATGTSISSIVAYWPLGSVGDVVGSNTLTNVNGVTFVDGKVDIAAHFDQSLQTALTRPDNAALSMGDIPCYWSCWARAEDLSDYRTIFAKHDTSIPSREYLLGYDPTVDRYVFRTTDDGVGPSHTATADTYGSPPLDTWAFIECWYDNVAGTINIEVNRGGADSTAHTGGVFAGTSLFAIGRNSELLQHWQGDIDELLIAKALPTDVQRDIIYNAGGGITYPFALSIATVAITSSPKANQTFQRVGSRGDIRIIGSVGTIAAPIEAQHADGPWVFIGNFFGEFQAWLPNQRQGQGTFKIRVMGNPATVQTVADVKIGEVFVIAGQSNASGRGVNNQAYTAPASAMKAALFGNDYEWHDYTTDPTDNPTNQVDEVSKDNGLLEKGSVWPLVATALVATLGVPVAFIPCAKGGATIGPTYLYDAGANTAEGWEVPTDHEDRDTLYGSMIYRSRYQGPNGVVMSPLLVRAVLWWQGESDCGATDALHKMNTATYQAYLLALANAVANDLGVKLMPAKLQNSTGLADVDEAQINTAIGNLWTAGGNVLTGPDLTGISTGADPFHLTTDQQLEDAADLWVAAIEAAFDWS